MILPQDAAFFRPLMGIECVRGRFECGGWKGAGSIDTFSQGKRVNRTGPFPPSRTGPFPPFTMVGLDAGGRPYDPREFAGPTIFVFGSERSGLSEAVRTRCDEIVSLPMAADVSSLNLATSVAAVMYLWMYGV